MTISRRKLFSFLPAAAAVPIAATGLVGSAPRDLIVSAPGATISNCEFTGELHLMDGGDYATITRCVFYRGDDSIEQKRLKAAWWGAGVNA